MPSRKLKNTFNAVPAQQQVDAFVEAAGTGNLPGVAAFLKNYSSAVNEKNSCGQMAMTLAAIYGRAEVIGLLLEHGADINQKDNSNQWTPLMAAAWNGHKGVVRLLLEKDAAVDERNDLGWTALMNAVWCEYKETAQLLLEAGASLDAQNSEGNTPLMLAQKNMARPPGSRQAEVIALIEQWPELQRRVREEKIADFSPVLKRDIPALRPLKLPLRVL